MAHPYGTLPYGLLHRDMLQIAVKHNFSKIMHRFYSWLLVNANPYSAEIYGNPTVVEVAELLKTNKQSLYNMRDVFVDLKMIKQEVGVHGLKCVVEHVKMARAEIKAQNAIDKAQYATDDDDATHPYAYLIAGKIPRDFVKTAVENNLSKFPQRHFWYITLNLAPQGHLTRLDEIEDIGKHIGTNSTVTMLAEFQKLRENRTFLGETPKYDPRALRTCCCCDGRSRRTAAQERTAENLPHRNGFLFEAAGKNLRAETPAAGGETP